MRVNPPASRSGAHAGRRAARAWSTSRARAQACRPPRSTACCNRRPGVRDATVQRVLKAARRARLPARERAATRRCAPQPLRLRLPAAGGHQPLHPHARRHGRLFAGAAGRPSTCAAAREFIESFNPQSSPTRCCATAGARDGIAFMALEHPAVREAVGTLAERGVPVVTLISDLSNSRARRLHRAGQPRRRPHRRLPHRPLHRRARRPRSR